MFSKSPLFRSRPLMVALFISAIISFLGFSLFTAVFLPGNAVVTERRMQWTPGEKSEQQWIYDVKNASIANRFESAISIASQGLIDYPRSEALANLKAIHEIELRRFKSAVITLERARRVVTITDGTLDNNLAWAGLWTGMNRDRLQNLYIAALMMENKSKTKSKNKCETIHTGMWVEYVVASENTGATRLRAIDNFDSLRRAYDGCERRKVTNKDEYGYELVGAGLIEREMRGFMLHHPSKFRSRLFELGRKKISWSITPKTICENASPLMSLRSQCEQEIRRSRSQHHCDRPGVHCQ